MPGIAERLQAVRLQLAKSCAESGRAADSVLLLAVSKRQPSSAIVQAFRAGQHDFGENYAQELRDKSDQLALPELRWHFIGPLQRNKLRYVVGRCALIHSIERAEQVEAIDQRASRMQCTQDVLLQINISGEASKSGAAPDEAEGLLALCEKSAHLRCRGLMTMPPFDEDAEASTPYFSALRSLRDSLGSERLPELSMGMSHDYAAAIREGATIVRIGTAIFGPRN
ncbi:MAG: YggS family pyridoxal phosphate-dependent enzyme [Deltaproteobacteria bacterium]|nr:YggS family pyridoxal phosphate-dependent enzyme [Deltaproteobacteria bacterium]